MCCIERTMINYIATVFPYSSSITTGNTLSTPRQQISTFKPSFPNCSLLDQYHQNLTIDLPTPIVDEYQKSATDQKKP